MDGGSTHIRCILRCHREISWHLRHHRATSASGRQAGEAAHWAACGGVVVGMLLWSILSSAIARSLPLRGMCQSGWQHERSDVISPFSTRVRGTTIIDNDLRPSVRLRRLQSCMPLASWLKVGLSRRPQRFRRMAGLASNGHSSSVQTGSQKKGDYGPDLKRTAFWWIAGLREMS